MADKYGYTGPEPGVDAKTRLKSRAERFMRRRAEQIHLELVMDWAMAGTGDYPSQRDADQDAMEELELLLRGIGKWGFVDPDTLPWEHRPPRGYTPDWEKDLLGE